MLNMKKGLAIVLAAATALTFAPVSTLGLQGVVEAQAATAVNGSATVTFAADTVSNETGVVSGNTTNVVKSGSTFTVTLKAIGDSAITTVSVAVKKKSDDTVATGLTADKTSVSDLSKAQSEVVTVTAGATATSDDYYVELTNGTSVTKVPFHYNTEAAQDAADATAAETSLINSLKANAPFGGISTDIVAVNGAKYDLVNGATKITYSGKTYSASELTWYLTKETVKANVTEYKNIDLDAAMGSVDAGQGKLTVNVKDASKFTSDLTGVKVVAVAHDGSSDTVVFADNFAATNGSAYTSLKNYTASATASETDAGTNAKDISKDLLDGVLITGVNNNKIHAADTTARGTNKKESAKNFKLDLTGLANGATDNVFKGAKLQTVSAATRKTGTYFETAYIPYTVTSESKTYVAKIDITVSVGTGPKVVVKDGNTVYGANDSTPLSTDPTIYLDLKTNTTFDIKKFASSNMDGTTYDYDTSSTNVEVKDGVITAKTVGTASVKVSPKANGVSGADFYLDVRVNANGFDTLTVAGKDKDEATVLNYKSFTNNDSKLSDNKFYNKQTGAKNQTAASEAKLAAAQVKYIQIEVTGNEANDVKEAIAATSANKANLTYSLANASVYGESIDEKTGVITIPHSWTTDSHFNSYGFPVKVVSASTNTSAMTTSYFYVVVDYADATLNGLQDSYDIGTTLFTPAKASWLNLSNGAALVSNGTVKTQTLDKTNELVGSNIYDADSANVFTKWLGNDTVTVGNDTYKNIVANATVAGKTMHVLVSSGDAANKVGTAYKVVTLKSVEGKHNYVKKIENVANGKTIYETNGVTSGASIVIDKATTVKVTVAYAPAASLNPKTDPAFTIDDGNNPFNYNTEKYFVAATENPKTYEITLLPSQEGTQIISINPTQGRLSLTDYSLVDSDSTKLAVKYDTTPVPAKVTGLKIANKKGAAVKVSWKSQGSGIKYRVYKKVGNGDWVAKNVSSSSTSLKVKKGAKVTVKVKAYAKSSSNKTIWGPKATQASKKTDKK